ncbi:hypothetical protein FRC17_008208 [Serendipita sp. 399]|nr:hypothetical protein FRC17_008208 [Serendipita sp. 399]
MDSSQDLLVLIEGGVAGSTSITASFLSLTSGDSHPLSSGEYVIPSPSDGAVRGFTITVMGVFMGLLISNFKFIVYDWKRGKLVVDIPFDDGDIINTFFFLDRERLGLVRGLRRPAHIEIYRFIDGNIRLSGPVLTATYHLPTLIDGVRLGEISCRSDPPPHQIETSTTYTNNSSVHSPPPFIPRLEDRIFVVDMLFLHGRTAVGTCVIVIRGETLMNVPKGSELVDGTYVVTPDLWMHDTHMQPMTTMGNWACFVYGSRFVTISFNPPIDESESDEEEEEPGRLGWPLQIVTFDMNPRMIAWAKSKGCETTPYGISYAFGTVEDLDCTVCESNYTSVSSELLREPWVAERPLIATGFKADDIVSRADDDFVVMLNGERLIVIQASRHLPPCPALFLSSPTR